MNPAVSFIIPAFNAALTIERTLRSVARQSLTQWEAIVVDDGSTDDTVKIARNARGRVMVVSQANRGLAGARNTGLALASGRCVTFLDADDLVTPDYAASMLDALGDADGIACWYEMIDEHDQPIGWVSRPAAADLTLDRLLHVNSIACTVTLRRTRLHEFCPARAVFNQSLRVTEDWDLWLRITRAGWNWAPPVERPLFRYRLRPGSLSRGSEQMWRTGMQVIAANAPDDHARAAAQRTFTLHCVARAAAERNSSLTGQMLEALGTLSAADCSAIAAAWITAMQRIEIIGEHQAAARHADWARLMQSMLAGRPQAAEIAAAVRSCTGDWPKLADRVADSLGAGEIPVVYGMGWNGRALICELAGRVAGPIAWIDDSPQASPPESLRTRCARITIPELERRHCVIVTPNNRRPILEKLAAVTVARVVTPDAA